MNDIYNKNGKSIALDIKNVDYDVLMCKHTSFKVGGPVDIFIEPENIEELTAALHYLSDRRIPYHIIGNGSNLLVSDKGIRGAVVKIADKLGSIAINGDEIIAEAGILLSALSKAAARSQLTGLEFASGIPGTLGGGIAMNAGAYGGELRDVVQWVEVIDDNFEIIRIENKNMDFRYRHSIVQDKGYVVVKCGMKLQKGDPDKISEYMAELTAKRKSKQPLHLPSAGSTFKRPEGYYAGKLIEDSGLKGFQIGGAQVSPIHCGFVVNSAEATADDIYKLIQHIQNTVYEKFDVKLETEVKVLGEF